MNEPSYYVDPDRMVTEARKVADFAYRQGVGEAVAVDELIAENLRLRSHLTRIRAEQREATLEDAAEWLYTLGRDDMARALLRDLDVR